MLTTQVLIDAALARGLELPDDWFKPKCSKCGWKLNQFTRCADPCCAADESRKSGERLLCPPDLTAPANLYELLRFADAVNERPVALSVGWPGSEIMASVLGKLGRGDDRTTAVLVACAKALNIEDFPNAKP